MNPKDILARNGGARYSHRNSKTGTVVTVYDSLSSSMDTDRGRWQVVCEDHASLSCYQTLRVAREWMSYPEEWCEDCAALWRKTT